MDSKAVIEKLIPRFNTKNVRYGLMGRFAQSETSGSDMAIAARSQRKHFLKNGKADVDAYTDFVTAFNEFINHEPKPFKQTIERDMRL